MSNSWFQFKQFIIHQDKSALKVCTDSCILGAWYAQRIRAADTILDIGSGTGLLMMMLAQKAKATIHGVEIDLNSYQQSLENIRQKKWDQQMQVFLGDIRNLDLHNKYDLIISNPPFFENSLPSKTQKEQVAKHSSMLNLSELIRVVVLYLNENGRFGILIPHHRFAELETLAKPEGLFVNEKLHIRHSKEHQPFRMIVELNRNQPEQIQENQLNIRETDGSYSPFFIELLKDYYLYL